MQLSQNSKAALIQRITLDWCIIPTAKPDFAVPGWKMRPIQHLGHDKSLPLILMFPWHPLPELHATIGLAPFVVHEATHPRVWRLLPWAPNGELFLLQLSYKIMSPFLKLHFKNPVLAFSHCPSVKFLAFYRCERFAVLESVRRWDHYLNHFFAWKIDGPWHVCSMTGKKVNVTVQGIKKIMRKEPINILFIIHNLGK